MKPLFITFEGPEGSGKSTHVKLLSEWMQNRSIPHVTTKEPGSPHVNECVEIRKFLLNPNNNIVPKSELLLFLADRAQHIHSFIIPSLHQSGCHVLCDRYIGSTIAIQSARGVSRYMIDMLLEFTIDSLKPDLTFLLDVPSEIGLKRARAKSKYDGGDRIEREDIEFHNKVRHNFLKLAESISEDKFRVIDATPPKTIEETHSEIIKHVSKQLFVAGLEVPNE